MTVLGPSTVTAGAVSPAARPALPRRAYEAVAALLAVGTAGQAPPTVRQIVLANVIALMGPAATLPFQIFYLAQDPGYYAALIGINAGFTIVYLAVLPMNRRGWFDAARNLSLAAVYSHLLVVTAFISTGAGVHLYYFTIGSVLPLIFARRRDGLAAGLMTLSAVLFVVCHVAFPPGRTPIAIPEPVLAVMYAGCASGAVLFAAVCAYLFRVEIDRVEVALTETNAELQRLTSVDPLTGLGNRRSLDAYLAREWPQCARRGDVVSVLLCDVDCFKAYNDRYGHLAGDACLRQVGAAVGRAARRSTDMAARYGGEEFLVLLAGTDAPGATRTAEQLRAEVAALGIAHERSTAARMVTVSIGVASARLAPKDGRQPEHLVRQADAALYVAKANGRNRVQVAGD